MPLPEEVFETPEFAPLEAAPEPDIEIPEMTVEVQPERLRIRYRKKPPPTRNKERHRPRNSEKKGGSKFYRQMLRIINKTYGAVDEIVDVIEAFDNNLYSDSYHWVETPTGRRERRRMLAMYDIQRRSLQITGRLKDWTAMHIEMFDGPRKGMYELDVEGFIRDLAINDALDRATGAMSRRRKGELFGSGTRTMFSRFGPF
jgi:hypothetical protein